MKLENGDGFIRFLFGNLTGNKKYKKYQWIEVDLKKAPNDRRPESYIVAGAIGTFRRCATY